MKTLLVVVSLAVFAHTAMATGLNTSVSVDMVGGFNTDGKDAVDDAFNIREAELMLFSPVDHLFEGMLNIAAHREDGVAFFELHEATISSSKLIPSSKFKIGQYFLGVGRLNRFHRHDWPFISAPEVFQQFFGDEGVSDTGFEYSWMLPTGFFLELTLGITNGWVYGHAHDEGHKPLMPTHYGRLATFFEIGSDLGVATGINLLKRKSDTGETMELIGLDFVAKQSGGSFSRWLLQGEVWRRKLDPGNNSWGAYAYPQYGFNKELFFGCRLDYFTIQNLENAIGDKVDNAKYAVVPTLTYKTSEFATFRLAYNYQLDKQDNVDDESRQYIEMQAAFILGAHPAHDF